MQKKFEYFEGTDTALPSHLEDTVAPLCSYASTQPKNENIFNFFCLIACICQTFVVSLHANLLFYASYNVKIEKYRLGTNR